MIFCEGIIKTIELPKSLLDCKKDYIKDNYLSGGVLRAQVLHKIRLDVVFAGQLAGQSLYHSQVDFIFHGTQCSNCLPRICCPFKNFSISNSPEK